MRESVLLFALFSMQMSHQPKDGPLSESLKIAVDGSVTMLLNGPNSSLLRKEKMNALEV